MAKKYKFGAGKKAYYVGFPTTYMLEGGCGFGGAFNSALVAHTKFHPLALKLELNPVWRLMIRWCYCCNWLFCGFPVTSVRVVATGGFTHGVDLTRNWTKPIEVGLAQPRCRCLWGRKASELSSWDSGSPVDCYLEISAITGVSKSQQERLPDI